MTMMSVLLRISLPSTVAMLGIAFGGMGSCVPRLEPLAVDDEEANPSLPDGARVELVDVAFAWPLPTGTGAGVEGHLGPILNCEMVGAFEPLTRSDESADLCAALTVTAARLDPCFREGGPDAECRPQLRLVLQPVFDGSARDAAIHVFYEIEERVLLRGVARMIELRLGAGDDGRGPLNVHPLLTTKEGRRAVALIFDEILKDARFDHFTQITVHGDDAAWTFEFRTFLDGKVSEGDARLQHVLAPSPDAIDMSITPASASQDEFSLLLDEATAAAASFEEQQAAYDRAGRVENPNFHDPGTVDCATCHVAAPARAATRARFARAGVALFEGPDTATSARHDLTSSAVFANPQFIHAFAYRGTALSINQRVVNESARSADLVDARLIEEGVLQ